MAKLDIDIMTEGGRRFYRTVRYEYNPLFKIDLEDIKRFVHSRCPTLKYEKDVVLMID